LHTLNETDVTRSRPIPCGVLQRWLSVKAALQIAFILFQILNGRATRAPCQAI